MKSYWKIKHIAIAASSVAIVIFCAIFIPLILLNGGGGEYKNVPQYLGMTVSQTNPSEQQAMFLSTINVAPITEDAAKEDFFTAIVNEDVYVYINLNNPDNFEILSFTLNGYKYQSFQFEYGSTGQKLILKRNAGSIAGIMNYTLDEIKYIDGKEIKDAEIKGNKTVKVKVLGYINVTYHVNDDIETINNYSIIDGQQAPQWSPYRLDYNFKGWYTSEELTELYDFNIPVTQNIEFWTKWAVKLLTTAITVEYSVSVRENSADESKTVYSLKSGSLPDGLTLSDDIISGIATNGSEGFYEFVVLATHTESGETTETEFILEVYYFLDNC